MNCVSLKNCDLLDYVSYGRLMCHCCVFVTTIANFGIELTDFHVILRDFEATLNNLRPDS
jgi:hypothetical protein